MSSGADCHFWEIKPGGLWKYRLQRWPYGDNPDYDEFGPFRGFRGARRHLDENHQNPGGWGLHCLSIEDGHVHEFEVNEYAQIPVGVRVEIQVESLGLNPSKEDVAAKLREVVTADHIASMYPAYRWGPRKQCASCGKEPE